MRDINRGAAPHLKNQFRRQSEKWTRRCAFSARADAPFLGRRAGIIRRLAFLREPAVYHNETAARSGRASPPVLMKDKAVVVKQKFGRHFLPFPFAFRFIIIISAASSRRINEKLTVKKIQLRPVRKLNCFSFATSAFKAPKALKALKER